MQDYETNDCGTSDSAEQTTSSAAADQAGTPPHLASSGPVAQAQRIQSLDVIRGVALLGILVMNIQAFAMPFPAYLNPHAYGDLAGSNYIVWLLSHVLTDRKFMTIFSMLFGAGIVLMTSRREEAGARPAGLHFRRMAVLLGIGLCHAYLLWDGDILVTYAICGMVVYPMRGWRPGRLIAMGLLLIGIASGISMLFQWSMPNWPKEALQGFSDDIWQPPPEKVQEAIDLHRSSWAEYLPVRIKGALFFQTFILLIENLWRVSGLMLGGMALFKLGVFSASRSNRLYTTMFVAGLLIGLPAIVGGIYFRNSVDWDVSQAFFLGGQFNYWGSIPVALAWVALVMLICRGYVLHSLQRSLAAVGQMAFTNYLLQSAICTTLFFGHGLGWYGDVERVGQFGVVLCVWAVQLLLSPLWLSTYRFGPAEWVWRSLTYGKLQSFKR